MAQQCSEAGNYHVNAEGVLLEIVDDNRQACDVGQTGRTCNQFIELRNASYPL